MRKKRQRLSPASIIVHGVLVLLAAIVIMPLVLPFLFAFKTELEFAYHPWSWPTTFRWANFRMAWQMVQIGQGLMNTLIVCIGAVLTTVPPAAMAGYIFARYRTPMTTVLFYVVMAGFFIPTQMVLIPLYRMTMNLGLLDTLPGLYLPMAAFGAGHFAIFVRVIVPLTKPATILAVLLTFMSSWSDYLLALVLLSTQSKFTMQLRVARFIGNLGANYFPQYAAGVIISATPTILLYIIFHKHIIRGTTLAGALKG